MLHKISILIFLNANTNNIHFLDVQSSAGRFNILLVTNFEVWWGLVKRQYRQTNVYLNMPHLQCKPIGVSYSIRELVNGFGMI